MLQLFRQSYAAAWWLHRCRPTLHLPLSISQQEGCEFLVAESPDGLLDLADVYVTTDVPPSSEHHDEDAASRPPPAYRRPAGVGALGALPPPRWYQAVPWYSKWEGDVINERDPKAWVRGSACCHCLLLMPPLVTCLQQLLLLPVAPTTAGCHKPSTALTHRRSGSSTWCPLRPGNRTLSWTSMGRSLCWMPRQQSCSGARCTALRRPAHRSASCACASGAAWVGQVQRGVGEAPQAYADGRCVEDAFCAALRCCCRLAPHLHASLSLVLLPSPCCRDDAVTVDTLESIPGWEHVVQARLNGIPALRQVTAGGLAGQY